MNLGFPKRKLNPNESENLLDFRFAKKIVGIHQHSNLDSNSVTSVCPCPISTGMAGKPSRYVTPANHVNSAWPSLCGRHSKYQQMLGYKRAQHTIH